MKKKLNWQGYTAGDRNEQIEVVKKAVSESDGFIIHFQMFSDLALSLSIGIEEMNILCLHRELQNILTLSGPVPGDLNPNAREEWLIFLNVSFSKGKGTLETEVPMVPG